MEKKTQAHSCPHTRNQLCEACKELGLWGNRSVAFMGTENDFHSKTKRISMLGLKGILHQLSSLEQELHCPQLGHYLSLTS